MIGGSMLTAERLRELLAYDPETGVFRWRVTRSNRAPAGSLAGCDGGPKVGWVIRIDGELLRAGRLAWLHANGEWPKHPLAPRNGDITDLRLSNLEEAPLGSALPPPPRASGNGLTAERLRELVTYDPSSGLFRHRAPVGIRVKSGDIAGYVNARGYVLMHIDGRTYRAHHLAWFYVHGRWPVGKIDHRDRDRSNNRIDNLREASASQNQANRGKQSNNSSGYKGVTWVAHRKKWVARIGFQRQAHHLGFFDTPEAAHEAYRIAAERLHGEFARPD